MLKLSSLILLFSSMLYIPVGGMFIFEKNKYENNYLINIDSTKYKVVMKKKNLKKLNLKKGKYFTFNLNNEEKYLKINQIKKIGDYAEIILEKRGKWSEDIEQFKAISYFLEKNPFWKEIFN